MPTETFYCDTVYLVGNNTSKRIISSSTYNFGRNNDFNEIFGAFDVPERIYGAIINSTRLGFYVTGAKKNDMPAEDFWLWDLGRKVEAINSLNSLVHGPFQERFSENGWKTLDDGLYLDFVEYGFSVSASDPDLNPTITIKGSNRPYLTIQYEQAKLVATNMSPSEGFVDKHKPITFSANISTKSTLNRMKYARSVKFKYRDGTSGNFTIKEITVNNTGQTNKKAQLTLPKDTFHSGTIQWGIESAIGLDGDVTVFSGTIWNLSTVDAKSTATPISPNNAMIDVESANVFKWKHNISTGSTPTGYDLQYSTDGHNWLPLASNKSTASLQYTVPANKLPAGKLWWRVRTYNGDGIAGEWSNSAAIVGYGAPPTPVITSVSNTARPTVTWTSSTQIAYDLGIYQGETEILRTGETAGTAKTYVSPDFLEDGTYTAKLRIENSGLYWSKWATKNFTIRTSKPAAPSISGKSVKNGVIIISSNKGNGLFLLRDGIPIAKIINGQAEDYTAVGWHEYKIRLVSGAAFSDSAPLMLETKIDQAVIASADTPKNMIGPLLQSEKNVYPSTSNIASEMLFYAGRKYPVAVTTDDITEQFSPSFASLTPNQYERIKKKMESSTIVIYRNNGGECAYCLITNISPSRSNFFTSWGMTLSRVDYIERIDYDGV